MRIAKDSKTFARMSWLVSLLLTCLTVFVLSRVVGELHPSVTISPPSPPRIRYLGMISDESPMVAELKAVWSPALVSLPARVMSRSATQSRQPKLVPSLDLPPAAPHFLDAKGADVGDIDTILPSIYTDFPENLSGKYAPATSVDPPFAKVPASTGIPVLLEFSKNLEGKVDTAHLPLEKWRKVQKQQSLLLHIAFGKDGRVNKAILDTPGQDRALNSEVIQEVLKCSLLNPGTETSGRLAIIFPGTLTGRR